MPHPIRRITDAIDEAAGPSAAEQAAALLPLVYNPDDTPVAGMVAAANEAATTPHERAVMADIVRELRD
ncbi:hypothetical protein [Pseudonocardia alni]|uniref:hypothetical protein n=1 Tax=Pseudonocardia alni TaxID=33907 RepID=UPI0033276E3A